MDATKLEQGNAWLKKIKAMENISNELKQFEDINKVEGISSVLFYTTAGDKHTLEVTEGMFESPENKENFRAIAQDAIDRFNTLINQESQAVQNDFDLL
jgi:hypothetical protein